ncbi:hypothetical protein WKW80_34170 [Variovorax humicola]|uniref:Uncharacterized protein n=1 Tax=Variovorax humicola TaxID=1769758 RepID=A0ABU8WAP3_9BURK
MNESHASIGYELRFCRLCDGGQAFAFPCDALGHVDMDSMSERTRNNYLFARALMGIDIARPDVRLRGH